MDLKITSQYKVPLIRQRMSVQDGFKDEKEALAFGNNACGAACLKMVLEAFGKKNIPTVKKLMEEGSKKGFYSEPDGWLHQGIVRMAKDYGINAQRAHFKTPWRIAEKIEKNQLIIASVSFTFDKNKRGGHLVVIYGIEIKDGRLEKIYFNDSSGWGQHHHIVDGESFLGSWMGNVIMFGI
jgi:ABC-type bacteriocin/lantibiotic exporter with double-glycine peptidase domain